MVGCSPDFSDYADLSTDGGTILIDINCDTDTCSGDAVDFSLTLSEHLAWGSDGQAEFLLYRVDYALDSGEVAFFSDEATVSVGSGATTTFSLAIAGNDQRSTIGITTDDVVSGEATVTLAGYDPMNASVQVSATFPIQFQDVIGDSSDSTLDTGLGAN
ncbi:MAG: hypothetical protein ACI8RZ_007631 [Myxococcota bacterium]|jgi:hypothetical protein